MKISGKVSRLEWLKGAVKLIKIAERHEMKGGIPRNQRKIARQYFYRLVKTMPSSDLAHDLDWAAEKLGFFAVTGPLPPYQEMKVIGSPSLPKGR